MVPPTLLTTVLLALAVAAEPIMVKRSSVTLPFAKRINIIDASVQNLLQHDQARANALRARGEAKAAGLESRQVNSEATNAAVSYIASVGVGSPATQCK